MAQTLADLGALKGTAPEGQPEAPEGANTWPARAEVPLEARSILLARRAW